METKTSGSKLRRALIRAGSAVLLALILLSVTGFAFIKLISGPDAITDFDDVAEGDYVSANISLIMDFYAEGYTHTGGDAATLYAVTAGDTDFYSVIIPKRYFDSAKIIEGDTDDFIAGSRDKLSRYFTVTGTVYTLSDDELTYLYGWFTDNMQWLQSIDAIGEVSDYTDYLSVYALRVDYIGSTPTVWVYILSSIAWALLVYAVVVFIRASLGKYSEKSSVSPAAAITAPEQQDGAEASSLSADALPEEKEVDKPDES